MNTSIKCICLGCPSSTHSLGTSLLMAECVSGSFNAANKCRGTCALCLAAQKLALSAA